MPNTSRTEISSVGFASMLKLPSAMLSSGVMGGISMPCRRATYRGGLQGEGRRRLILDRAAGWIGYCSVPAADAHGDVGAQPRQLVAVERGPDRCGRL